MPKEQTDAFRDFQELDMDKKNELIIEELIIPSYLPAYAQLNLEAWQSLKTQTKLLIVKYIFSAPNFHVSGMKFLDKVQIVDLQTVTRYSKKFFYMFALDKLIDEVFTSRNDEIIGDFLYALASDQDFANWIPSRIQLLQKQSKDNLKKMLSDSLIRFDSKTTAIETAANHLNQSFILLALELRQDLQVENPDFTQAILNAFNSIYSNQEYEYTAKKHSLFEIQEWLTQNKSTKTEEHLLSEITKLQSVCQGISSEEKNGIEGQKEKRPRLLL